MRINEVILESYQTDEGVLGTIGRGVAAGLGGLAKGAGMISGVGQGMKQAYQKGKATSAAHIAGDVPKQPKPISGPGNPTYDAEYARLTQPQAAPAAAAPTQDAGAIKSQISQLQAKLADLQAQLKTASAPAARIEPTLEPEKPAAGATNTAQTPTVGGKPAPTAPSMKPMTVPGSVTPTMKQPNLQVQPGGKAAAKPAGPSQAEIDADRERMATGTNENKTGQFRSKFLGIDI